MRQVFTAAAFVFVLTVLPTAAFAQGGAAVSPVTVEGVSVYPALYSAQYRSVLPSDGTRGADARPAEWWRFLGAAGGCATVRVDATGFSPQVQARDGSPSGPVVGQGGAPLSVTALPGSDWYYVRVSTDDSRGGPYSLTIDRC